jgi:hypothetical protein
LQLDWPGHLLPLVRRYGEDAVLSAGLAVCGFPPIWAVTPRQLKLIALELAKETYHGS